MSILKIGKFPLNPETVQAIQQIIQDGYLKAPGFDTIHTIYPGIVTGSTMGFFTEPGLVGVKRQDCDPVFQNFGIPTRKVSWDPQPWEVLLAECFANMENSIATYALELGKDIADLTQTELATVIGEKLLEAMQKFFWRLVWFNEKEISNVANGGILSNTYVNSGGETEAVDVKYFNIIDGLFKQLEVLATNNPSQGVIIPANQGATYADQQLTPEDSKELLDELYYGGHKSLQLRGAADRMIVVTQSIYDAYEQYLSQRDFQIKTYENLTEGMQALHYKGMPLIAMPVWDEMIANFFDDGTKLFKPHRAVFATKSTLGVGVDKLAAFEEFNMWYNPDERKTKFEAMGKADTNILDPNKARVAM